MHGSLRSSFLAAAYYRGLELCILPHVQKWGLTPNQLTLSGTSLALIVPLGFFGHPSVGLVLMVLSGLADSLDGLLARRLNCISNFGALLDSSLDRLSDVSYLTGFWILFWPHPGYMGATILMFAAQLLTLMISYVKARAEALKVCCQVGLMERGARVLYLIAWALLLVLFPQSRPGVLWAGLVLYTGLVLATVIQRIIHIRRQMELAPPPAP